MAVQFSDPFAEIVDPPVFITELVLSGQGFHKLRDFETFLNLEHLFINNNKLTRLNGLDGCIRLRTLSVQNNRLRTLAHSSLSNLKYLEALYLNHNNLRNLKGTLSQLMHLKLLKTLNLFGNPCAEEPNYRMLVVSRFPELEVLDRHKITREEREKAMIMFPPPDPKSKEPKSFKLGRSVSAANLREMDEPAEDVNRKAHRPKSAAVQMSEVERMLEKQAERARKKREKEKQRLEEEAYLEAQKKHEEERVRWGEGSSAPLPSFFDFSHSRKQWEEEENREEELEVKRMISEKLERDRLQRMSGKMHRRPKPQTIQLEDEDSEKPRRRKTKFLFEASMLKVNEEPTKTADQSKVKGRASMFYKPPSSRSHVSSTSDAFDELSRSSGKIKLDKDMIETFEARSGRGARGLRHELAHYVI